MLNRLQLIRTPQTQKALYMLVNQGYRFPQNSACFGTESVHRFYTRGLFDNTKSKSPNIVLNEDPHKIDNVKIIKLLEELKNKIDTMEEEITKRKDEHKEMRMFVYIIVFIYGIFCSYKD